MDLWWTVNEAGVFWLMFTGDSRVGTFGTESAVRKRGGSRNLPYLNAKPRQIPLLDTYALSLIHI